MWVLLIFLILAVSLRALWAFGKGFLMAAAELCSMVIGLGILLFIMQKLGLTFEEAITCSAILYAALLAILGLCVNVQETDDSALQQGKSHTSTYVPPSPLHGNPFEPTADVMNWRAGTFYFSYDEIHNCLLFVKNQYSALHEGQRLMGYYINVNGNYAKEGDILANVTAEPLHFNSLGRPVQPPLDKYTDAELTTLTLSVYFIDSIPSATTGQPCKEEINFLAPDKPGALPNYSTPRKDMLESITLLHNIMVRNRHIDDNAI